MLFWLFPTTRRHVCVCVYERLIHRRRFLCVFFLSFFLAREGRGKTKITTVMFLVRRLLPLLTARTDCLRARVLRQQFWRDFQSNFMFIVSPQHRPSLTLHDRRAHKDSHPSASLPSCHVWLLDVFFPNMYCCGVI